MVVTYHLTHFQVKKYFSAFKMFFLRLLNYFNPISNVEFTFGNHLRLVEQLNRKDPRTVKTFKTFTFFFILKGVHLAFLFSWPPSELSRLLQYDVVTDVVETPGVNIAASALFTMMAVIYYRFCTFPPAKNNNLLKSILFHRKCTFFLLNKNTFSKGDLADSIRRKFTLAYNVLNSFKNVFQLISAVSHGILVYKLNYLLFQQHYTSFGLLFYNLLQFPPAVFLVFYLLSYASILSLVTSIGFIQLNILMVKLKQMHTFLKAVRKNFTSAKLSTFQRWQVEVLQQFSEYNHLYGWIFAVFLLINCPVNVYFVSILLYSSQNISLIGRLYMGVYTAVQLFSLFILHWYLLGFSQRFHAPALLVHQLTITSYKINSCSKSLSFLVKVAHYFSAYHTAQQYGVTYARFGRVTMQTFVRFLLHYCKFVLISYKIKEYSSSS